MYKQRCTSKAVQAVEIIAAVLWLFLVPGLSAQARTIHVAVIEAESVQPRDAKIYRLFKDELTTLLNGEHQVNFTTYPIGKAEGMARAHALLDQAFADPKTDMVLVLDMVANQILGHHPGFARPTFLPLVLNGQVLGYPLKGDASGKKNLHYETRQVDLEAEFKTLARVAPFKKAVLIPDAWIAGNIGKAMAVEARQDAKRAGVDLTIIPWDGDVDSLALKISADTEAVFYASFPSVRPDQVQGLIDMVNAKRLISFSLGGETLLRMGALAANSPDTDWKKLARQTAIHMQEVFLGTPASDLPVFFKTEDRLMINMETAGTIHFSPGFEVLAQEAVLINQGKVPADASYSLEQVVRRAVDVNLVVAARRLSALNSKEVATEAKSALLPKISSKVTYSRRKETRQTRAGAYAEDSTDGALTLTQPLFSEARWANWAVQKYSHLSEQEIVKETELDITLSAATAYLNVLVEKTSLDQERYNLKITRHNYQLAKNRVSVGSRNATDLYRWESELANAKRGVLTAQSRLEQQRQVLNRILDRPITESFSTTVETLDNPGLFISDPNIENLITTPESLGRLTDFFVKTGVKRAPELKQLEAQIAAGRRSLESDQRAFWLPELNLTGEYTRNFDETRAVGGMAAADNDWSIGLQISLPLCEGGARSARRAQSRLTLTRLNIEYRDTKSTIEQEIRSAVEALHAAYFSIDLARTSEQASQKNYELVEASYAQGQNSIVDVLDAQDALIQAREDSLNAVYTFLQDLMSLQRSLGGFDFCLPQRAQEQFIKDLTAYMQITSEKIEEM